MLSNINPHPNDTEIVFEEEGHKYSVTGCGQTVSVTKLVHAQFPQFNADEIISTMMAKDSWPSSQYYGKTPDDIKAMWSANGAQASAAGTKLHNDIESYYNEEPFTNDSDEFRHFLAFDEWRKKRGLTPYRAEWTVYDVPHLLAGTIDMCFIKSDGTIAIYDWKRVKQLRRVSYDKKTGISDACKDVPDCNYYHYSLQLALYRWILETNYGLKVSETALVALHPAQETYEIHTTADMAHVVEALLSSRKSS